MRILYLLTTLGIGGAERQVVDLAERMAQRGHTVALLILKHSDEEWPIKLPVMRLNMRKSPIGILRGLRFASNFLTLFRPDLLHSHTFPANLFARLLRLATLRGTIHPAVLNTIHNVYEGRWHRMALYRLTDSLCDQTTAVSEAAAWRFIRSHAVPRKKMQVLTNGIDTALFTPDRARRKRMRALLQVQRRFLWLAVGRLAPAKDYPNLLAAFAQLRIGQQDAGKTLEFDTELWIAGDGEIDAVRGVVPLSNHPGVKFLGLRRDIPDLLDAADGFVLSSAWEGLPLALGEAMAMEKTVVATDVGGVRELAGGHAILVPSRNSAALATAMRAAMRIDPIERKFLAHAGRQRICAAFSIDAKVDQWSTLYHRLLQDEFP